MNNATHRDASQPDKTNTEFKHRESASINKSQWCPGGVSSAQTPSHCHTFLAAGSVRGDPPGLTSSFCLHSLPVIPLTPGSTIIANRLALCWNIWDNPVLPPVLPAHTPSCFEFAPGVCGRCFRIWCAGWFAVLLMHLSEKPRS